MPPEPSSDALEVAQGEQALAVILHAGDIPPVEPKRTFLERLINLIVAPFLTGQRPHFAQVRNNAATTRRG